MSSNTQTSLINRFFIARIKQKKPLHRSWFPIIRSLT